VSTLSSANFTDVNILLTERNHIIKITYSRSARAYIRQLTNPSLPSHPAPLTYLLRYSFYHVVLNGLGLALSSAELLSHSHHNQLQTGN